MTGPMKRFFRRYRQGRNGPAFTHIVLACVVLAASSVPTVRYAEWLSANYGTLIADWLDPRTMAGPAGLAAALTIMYAPGGNWRDTALACLAGVVAACQFVVGATLAALLASHSYPVEPQDVIVRALPGIAGTATAAPVMFGVLALLNRRIDRRSADDQEKGAEVGEAG